MSVRGALASWLLRQLPRDQRRAAIIEAEPRFGRCVLIGSRATALLWPRPPLLGFGSEGEEVIGAAVDFEYRYDAMVRTIFADAPGVVPDPAPGVLFDAAFPDEPEPDLMLRRRNRGRASA